jgi:hypothetical protein
MKVTIDPPTNPSLERRRSACGTGETGQSDVATLLRTCSKWPNDR